MRKFCLFMLLASICILKINAQILRISTSPSSIVNQIPGYSQVSTITTKTFSYTPSTPPSSPTPVDEDSTTEDDKLYRYADNLSVNINMSDGNITSTSIGKVWTLRISIPNALNIGFVFNQFNLSASAEMYVFNEARTVMDSAIKQAHFQNSNQVGVFPIRDNSVIIYIVEPNNFGNIQSSIQIQKLEAGFQEMDDVGEIGSNGAQNRTSINCDPMILCQLNRMNSARAVARFVSNEHQGTGTLINNEGDNGRAFFLTAFHVIDVSNALGLHVSNGVIDANEEAALANARFQFQFWRTSCNGTINNTFIQFTGAIIRAAWKNSDVVLLELINPPGIGDAVNYAGWNRQTSAPSDNGSFIIHHPQGQDMRVTSTSNVKTWLWNNDYWTAHYGLGTVDKGSSGAALMNEYGQIVGQLRSGWSSCNFTGFGDRYGKFDKSWNGANLQQWLSPNQGLQSIGTLDLTNIPMSGPDFISCNSTGVYVTLGGLLDVTYEWVVSGNLQIVSGQFTSSVTLSVINNNASNSSVTVILRSPTKGRKRIYTITKSVLAGGPAPITGVSTEYHTVNCNVINYKFTVIGAQGATNYKWYYRNVTQGNSNFTLFKNSADNYASPPSDGSCDQLEIKVEATSSCNPNFFQSYSFNSDMCPPYEDGSCSYGMLLSASPNPSTGDVQLALINDPNVPPSNVRVKKIEKIKVSDRMGQTKKLINGNGLDKMMISLSALPNDIYTISVYNGSIWLSKQVIKN